ncbi:MAG TPA: hypothetical protein VKQ11_16115 [Candidatus Sulfotelmatobacter sp.]|nr:hypothetical protein [Candidatus Sulfotelmatobacter sp.]
MSITAISNHLPNYEPQPVSSRKPPIPNIQQFKQEFQQLGNDLQSGDLSAAQADFTQLQQIGPAGLSDPSRQPNSPMGRAFQQLSQDLQAGDLSAAQKDYAQIQQAFQQLAAQGHHHHGDSQLPQVLQKLAQALKSGDLASAQKAFDLLKHDVQKVAEGEPSVPSPEAGNVSVTA